MISLSYSLNVRGLLISKWLAFFFFFIQPHPEQLSSNIQHKTLKAETHLCGVVHCANVCVN